jgi:hypothetical protein
MAAVPGRHELADWLRANERGNPVTLGLPWDTPPPSSSERSIASVIEENPTSYDIEPVEQAPDLSDAEEAIRIDFFEACWPQLGSLLKRPRSEAEMLSRSDQLTKAQLRCWLETGMARGKITRKGRPARYSLAAESESDNGSPTSEEQLSLSTTG